MAMIRESSKRKEDKKYEKFHVMTKEKETDDLLTIGVENLPGGEDPFERLQKV